MVERTLNTRAIVLDREDLQEHHCRVTLYTAARGRVEAIAKGMRKRTSKLAAHAEPVTVTNVFLVQGKQWLIFAGSVPESRFLGIRQSLENLTAAGAICRLVDACCPDGVADARVESLILSTLQALDERRLTPEERDVLVHFFALQLVGLLGHQPDVERCGVCQLFFDDAAPMRFVSDGSLQHADCVRGEDRSSTSLTIGARRGLKYMVRAPLLDALRLRSANGGIQEMQRYIETLVEDHFRIPAGAAFWRFRNV